MTRLIDADALNREIDKVECFSRDPYVTYMSECITNAPTVDAEPVKHERWEHLKHYPNLLFCSGCGDPQVEGIARFYYYCPACGARMVEYETD